MSNNQRVLAQNTQLLQFAMYTSAMRPRFGKRMGNTPSRRTPSKTPRATAFTPSHFARKPITRPAGKIALPSSAPIGCLRILPRITRVALLKIWVGLKILGGGQVCCTCAAIGAYRPGGFFAEANISDENYCAWQEVGAMKIWAHCKSPYCNSGPRSGRSTRIAPGRQDPAPGSKPWLVPSGGNSAAKG